MEILTGFGFALPIAIGIAALGGGIGLGTAVKAAMDAIGRQPEASGRLFLPFIIGCALIEALTIYALVAFFAVPGIAQQIIQAASTAGH